MTSTLLLTVAFAAAQPPKTDDLPVLPAAWHGHWVGTLVITPDKGEPHEVPMALEVQPLAEGGRYSWKLTFGGGEKRQVRDYELAPKPGKPGRFEVDERNGIRIEARLAGTTLFALFHVGDSLVQSRYERSGDVLRVEMTAYATQKPLITKASGGDVEVRSPLLVSVQVADLRRLP